MRNVLVDGIDGEAFLRRGVVNGYSMQNPFMDPRVGVEVSHELETAGYLIDYTELVPTTEFEENGMRMARLLHATLNEMLCRIDGRDQNHLPLFSVRVFEPGVHGTTIHRNHPSIGPWAIGLTLKGEAPFNVYEHDQLPYNEVRPLVGDGTDPTPRASMNACAGAGWTLYTENELVPHASGLVHSPTQRELLILYGTR